MITIYKYPLLRAEQQTVLLPTGFQPVLVGLDPKGVTCLWAIVDTEAPSRYEVLWIVGTGCRVPNGRHLGSFLDGILESWHLFHLV